MGSKILGQLTEKKLIGQVQSVPLKLQDKSGREKSRVDLGRECLAAV